MTPLSKLNEEIGKEYAKRWNYASFTWNENNATGIKTAKQVRRNIKSFLLHSNERIFKAAIELVRDEIGEDEIWYEEYKCGGCEKCEACLLFMEDFGTEDVFNGVDRERSRIRFFLDELLK